MSAEFTGDFSCALTAWARPRAKHAYPACARDPIPLRSVKLRSRFRQTSTDKPLTSCKIHQDTFVSGTSVMYQSICILPTGMYPTFKMHLGYIRMHICISNLVMYTCRIHM